MDNNTRGQSAIRRAVELLDQRIKKLTEARDRWRAMLDKNSATPTQTEDKEDT